jgi:hypothetical protein
MTRRRNSSVSVKIPLESLQEAILRLSADDILLLKDTIERTLSSRGSGLKKEKLSRAEVEDLLAKTREIWADDPKVEKVFQYLGYEV